jgi:small GTP-binding protein
MRASKILLLGEIGVGKTSLVRRFVLDELPSDYRATMGVDLYRYDAHGLGARGDTSLQLVIWDTDGSYGTSIFKHIYARGADGTLIVGDITRPTTLEHMLRLASDFEDAFPRGQLRLVINKVDLVPPEERDRRVPAALRADRRGKVWTSAVTSENVTTAFHETANAILDTKLGS